MAAEPIDDATEGPQLLTSIAEVLRARWLLLTIGSLLMGVMAFGAASLIPPTFTARTTFLPPQSSQSGAAAALASLGSVAGLPGAAAPNRSSPEQYVALLQSVNIADRIIEHFKLREVYGEPLKVKARKVLAANVKISAGRKDGLISIEVDDPKPALAADIANRYVEELRRLTSELAFTEAQQRRVFFDRQLLQTRNNLERAQLALQAAGFGAGSLKAEPRATAEAFSRLQAETAAAGMRVQTLRISLAPGAIELQQAESTLASLTQQLARIEKSVQPGSSSANADYVQKLREFKYQETLFELFARQLELARADEAREGPLLQVVDAATQPEVKSRPQRLRMALTGMAAGFALLLTALTIWRWYQRRQKPNMP